MKLISILPFRACQNGYSDQVDCLISAGAKCFAHKSTKCTPLFAAIRGGHAQIVRTLLKHFPDVINVRFQSVIHFEYFNQKHKKY